MLTIRIKSWKNASWNERVMAAYWDEKKPNDVTIVEGHPLVKRNLPKILAHELWHRQHYKKIPWIIREVWPLHFFYETVFEEAYASWIGWKKMILHS